MGRDMLFYTGSIKGKTVIHLICRFKAFLELCTWSRRSDVVTHRCSAPWLTAGIRCRRPAHVNRSTCTSESRSVGDVVCERLSDL